MTIRARELIDQYLGEGGMSESSWDAQMRAVAAKEARKWNMPEKYMKQVLKDFWDAAPYSEHEPFKEFALNFGDFLVEFVPQFARQNPSIAPEGLDHKYDRSDMMYVLPFMKAKATKFWGMVPA